MLMGMTKEYSTQHHGQCSKHVLLFVHGNED